MQLPTAATTSPSKTRAKRGAASPLRALRGCRLGGPASALLFLAVCATAAFLVHRHASASADALGSLHRGPRALASESVANDGQARLAELHRRIHNSVLQYRELRRGTDDDDDTDDDAEADTLEESGRAAAQELFHVPGALANDDFVEDELSKKDIRKILNEKLGPMLGRGPGVDDDDDGDDDADDDEEEDDEADEEEDEEEEARRQTAAEETRQAQARDKRQAQAQQEKKGRRRRRAAVESADAEPMVEVQVAEKKRRQDELRPLKMKQSAAEEAPAQQVDDDDDLPAAFYEQLSKSESKTGAGGAGSSGDAGLRGRPYIASAGGQDSGGGSENGSSRRRRRQRRAAVAASGVKPIPRASWKEAMHQDAESERDDDDADTDGDDSAEGGARRRQPSAAEQAEAERVRLGLDADNQQRVEAFIKNRVKKADEVVDVAFTAGTQGGMAAGALFFVWSVLWFASRPFPPTHMVTRTQAPSPVRHSSLLY